MALGILTSCTAQTTTELRPSNQSTTARPTGVSEIRDRNNFRDEQQAAPRVYNAPLMPELYEHLNPMPFEAAVQMELELAEDLRSAGYTITGGR